MLPVCFYLPPLRALLYDGGRSGAGHVRVRRPARLARDHHTHVVGILRDELGRQRTIGAWVVHRFVGQVSTGQLCRNTHTESA